MAIPTPTLTSLSERQRSIPETIIDPDGDLWLVVGTVSPERFLVSSKVLQLASPVLHVKLKERESNGLLTPSTSDFGEISSLQELRLLDDYAESMKIILLEIHFKAHQ